MEWVAYPFSSRSSWSRNLTRVSCIAGSCRFLLQGIFPTQGLNLWPLHWQADSLPQSHQGRLPRVIRYHKKNIDAFCFHVYKSEGLLPSAEWLRSQGAYLIRAFRLHSTLLPPPVQGPQWSHVTLYSTMSSLMPRGTHSLGSRSRPSSSPSHTVCLKQTLGPSLGLHALLFPSALVGRWAHWQ